MSEDAFDAGVSAVCYGWRVAAAEGAAAVHFPR
jgi:hypothetical protein